MRVRVRVRVRVWVRVRVRVLQKIAGNAFFQKTTRHRPLEEKKK